MNALDGAVVRHSVRVSAENEWALGARVRLLGEALQLRGGRVLEVHQLTSKSVAAAARVAYELPLFARV